MDSSNHFTFHNVSINTAPFARYGTVGTRFTFHNVSINTDMEKLRERARETLHSTMFLLIPSQTRDK